VVAAETPEERARWERAESYSDAAVANDFHAEVWVIEDRNFGRMARRVSRRRRLLLRNHFAGPEAERRARGYRQALQSGRIKTERAARSDLQ
jgi:hypothetical protein